MEKFEQFKELVEEFVTENHKVIGQNTPCSDAEIVPDDWKGSYANALIKLFKDLKEVFEK